MGKSKAPPAPDYAAAAVKQGEANLTAGQQTAALNRPDQYDDNGSQTWSLKEGADVKNPQSGDWIVTNKLNDTQKALKNQQDTLSSQYAGLARDSLNTVGDTMQKKFDISGLPQAREVNSEGLRSFAEAPALTQQQKIDANGLSAFGQVHDSTEASRQRIAETMYSRQRAMLDPQTQQQNSDLEARLASQGITAGSQAYQREMDNTSRQQGQLYANARNDAILAGSQEDSRLHGIGLDNANFANQTRDQQLGERTSIAGFNNTADQQAFDQQMSNATYENAVRGQEFNERQISTAANNTLHSNAVQEALMQRELGMNEANALRSGNQIGGMNFQAYGGSGQIEAAPVYKAVGDKYSADVNSVNTKNANSAAAFKGLMSVGSLALSDRRMKKDIVQVGTHELGIPLYDFTYIHTGERRRGVMSDDVRKVMPSAVHRYPDGFDRVNYTMLGL